MGRYEDSLKVRNDIDFYNFLRKNKGVKSIEHLNTAFLYHPTGLERASINTTQHIWKYGDRFYKLAHLYYNCLLYTSPSPRDNRVSRMPSSA